MATFSFDQADNNKGGYNSGIKVTCGDGHSFVVKTSYKSHDVQCPNCGKLTRIP